MSRRDSRALLLARLALLAGCMLPSLSGCLTAPQAPASSKAALAPITEERPERLVDVDPATLYTPEQLLPLVVLSAGPLPATIRGLLAADLPALLADPARIARIDLRLAHDPGQWPETQQPPGAARLVRVIDLRECDTGPCSRILDIQAGSTLSTAQREVPQRALLPLIEWLSRHPMPMVAAREASSASTDDASANTWFELRILLRDQPHPMLVPRQELDAPRDALVADSLTPPENAPQKASPAGPESAPVWVDENPDGQLYQQVLDPDATLLTLTFSPPADVATARTLMPLVEWLAEHYLPESSTTG